MSDVATLTSNLRKYTESCAKRNGFSDNTAVKLFPTTITNDHIIEMFYLIGKEYCGMSKLQRNYENICRRGISKFLRSLKNRMSLCQWNNENQQFDGKTLIAVDSNLVEFGNCTHSATRVQYLNKLLSTILFRTNDGIYFKILLRKQFDIVDTSCYKLLWCSVLCDSKGITKKSTMNNLTSNGYLG